MSVGTLLWHMGPVFCCRCYCGDFFAKRLQEISPILTIGFLSFVCWFFALHFFFFYQIFISMGRCFGLWFRVFSEGIFVVIASAKSPRGIPPFWAVVS